MNTYNIMVFFILFVFISCKQAGKKAERIPADTLLVKTKHQEEQHLKRIDLAHGFFVLIGREEDLGEFSTYSYFELKRNQTSILVDSSLTEYVFENKLFPVLIQTSADNFQLLFEINDRPNKNYLKRFFIKNNKFFAKDMLPLFESKAMDLNDDGIKEYIGYWGYSEIYGENDEFTNYDPILYYSVKENGLFLDSILTKQRNELIYGKFYGYSFDGEVKLPVKVIENFEQELKRIHSVK